MMMMQCRVHKCMQNWVDPTKWKAVGPHVHPYDISWFKLVFEFKSNQIEYSQINYAQIDAIIMAFWPISLCQACMQIIHVYYVLRICTHT